MSLDYVPTLPRDLAPGMQAVFFVQHNSYNQLHHQPCEILHVKKVRRDGITQYQVTIIEPVIPGDSRTQTRRSIRYVWPRDKVKVAISQEAS